MLLDRDEQRRSIAHVGEKRRKSAGCKREAWDALSVARERLDWGGSDPAPVQQRVPWKSGTVAEIERIATGYEHQNLPVGCNKVEGDMELGFHCATRRKLAESGRDWQELAELTELTDVHSADADL